jgi:hypothetical protein
VSDDYEPDFESKARFALPMSMLYPPTVFAAMAQQNLPPKEEAWALMDIYFKYAVRHYIHILLFTDTEQ